MYFFAFWFLEVILILRIQIFDIGSVFRRVGTFSGEVRNWKAFEFFSIIENILNETLKIPFPLILVEKLIL